jgi:hypothetical protein
METAGFCRTWYISMRLHGVSFHNTELFILTAVRASDLTELWLALCFFRHYTVVEYGGEGL